MYAVTSTANYFFTSRVKNRKSPNIVRNKSFIVDPNGKELRLNVSGFSYRLHESYLKHFPETLLGSSEKDFFYDHKNKEYFFDRDPHIFRFILKFYKTGKLHCSEQECNEAFTDELIFFGIKPDDVAHCCGDNYADYILKQEEAKSAEVVPKAPDTFREKCWLFVDDPSFSLPSKLFFYLSCLVITLSITINTVETVECDVYLNNTLTTLRCSDAHPRVFFMIDTVCVTFFTLEYLLRLCSVKARLKYLKSTMSIIDILAILPYFIDLIMLEFNIGKDGIFSNILVGLRTLRIIRVFKLARHSQRLRDLSSSIASATSELGFILFMYINVVIIFATVIYYAEHDKENDSGFVSIPEAMWYTVVTTTTLGYGDIVPHTIQGKLIGSLCCLMGVLVIALPVPIIQMKSPTPL